MRYQNSLQKLDWCKLLIIVGITGLIIDFSRAVYISRTWVISLDAPLMQYIAQTIRAGAVPYRDTFDMNFPLVYLIHIFEEMVFGESDFGFRLFELGWLAMTCAAIALILKKEGRVAQITAALFFGCFHLGMSNDMMAQRDFLMCVFTVMSLYFVTRFSDTQKSTALFFSGLMIGAAVCVKPTILMLAPAVLVYLVATTPLKNLVNPIIYFIQGCSAVPIAMLAWLFVVGGLADFIALIFDFLIPFYSKFAKCTLYDCVVFMLRYCAIFLPILLIPYKRSQTTAVQDLATLGLFAAIFCLILQSKAWPYHIYPLIPFLCILAGMRVASLYSTERGLSKTLCTILCLVGFYAFGQGRMLTPVHLYTSDIRYVKELANDISKLTKQGDTVQVMDTAWGLLNALYRLNIRMPTRYLYDFPFYAMAEQPYIVKIRADFMQKMNLNRPKLIVVSTQDWAAGKQNAERFKNFPAFEEFIKENYFLSVKKSGYWIYERIL